MFVDGVACSKEMQLPEQCGHSLIQLECNWSLKRNHLPMRFGMKRNIFSDCRAIASVSAARLSDCLVVVDISAWSLCTLDLGVRLLDPQWNQLVEVITE